MNNRINKLEDKVKGLRGFTNQAQASEPSPIPQAVTGVLATTGAEILQANSNRPYSDTEEDATDKFFAWLKKDFMVKLGAFLLLLAAGWFVSYAIAEEWIGPMGQIALGLIAGAAVLSLGVWRIKSFQHQGGIFTALGGSVMIMTLFAAREIYDLFTPTSALAIMFGVVVLMALVSVRYQSQALAFATLALGSLSPLLTNSPTPSAEGLFTYLLIVAAGTLWVVWCTGWTNLTLASLIITFFYSFPFLNSSANEGAVMMFTFIFVALYYGANIISLVRRRVEGRRHLLTHTTTALGTAIFLVVWIQATVAAEWQSLLYVLWAMVFALGTYVVYSYTANYAAFYLYAAISAGLIGVATAAELSGPALTIAYILEISLVILAAVKISRGIKIPSKISLLYVVPVILSLESLLPYNWYRGIPLPDFIVLLLMTTVLINMGLVFQKLLNEGNEKNPEGYHKYISTLFSIGGFYAVALVWLCTHALFENDLATLLSLVAYTVTGLTMIVISKTENVKGLKLAGAVLIGVVVLRLLFIDVWEMSEGGRIITFLVIGVMLVSTAFMQKLRGDR